MRSEGGEFTRSCVIWILLGGSAYGFTLGLWQWGTLQPLYVALKIPLLFLMVAFGNGLLNGMLAQLIGLPLRPLIGPGKTFLPEGKRFFLVHWMDMCETDYVE